MIRLELKREPYWLDLGHGVRLHVRPCTTALVMAARAAVARTAPPSDDQAAGTLTAVFVKTLAQLAVDRWEGVGGVDGEPAAISPEGIDALLDLWPIADAFECQYLGPTLLLDKEKNG